MNKCIINGKMYNTETATCVGEYQYSYPGNLDYWYEALYRKKNGEYFLSGEGGPASRYSVAVGCNNWRSGEKIVPMDIAKAKEWVEAHLSVDDYIDEFGELEE